MIVAEYRVLIHAPNGATAEEVAAHFAELEHAIDSEIQADLESLIGSSIPLTVTVGMIR